MRHPRPAVPCALLALGLTSFDALAQEPNRGSVSAEDRATISSCIRDSADRPRACIGAIAVVCARQASGDRREAEIACTRREAGVWRERLDLAARAFAQRLESGPRNRFAAAQRGWEEYTALNCALIGEIERPARSPVMQAGCELRAVAERALEIERLARRHAQASQPRPQLHR